MEGIPRRKRTEGNTPQSGVQEPVTESLLETEMNTSPSWNTAPLVNRSHQNAMAHMAHISHTDSQSSPINSILPGSGHTHQQGAGLIETDFLPASMTANETPWSPAQADLLPQDTSMLELLARISELVTLARANSTMLSEHIAPSQGETEELRQSQEALSRSLAELEWYTNIAQAASALQSEQRSREQGEIAAALARASSEAAQQLEQVIRGQEVTWRRLDTLYTQQEQTGASLRRAWNNISSIGTQASQALEISQELQEEKGGRSLHTTPILISVLFSVGTLLLAYLWVQS